MCITLMPEIDEALLILLYDVLSDKRIILIPKMDGVPENTCKIRRDRQNFGLKTRVFSGRNYYNVGQR